MEYSQYQKDIFQEVEEGEGNLFISAAAGSGKTFTIVKASELVPTGKRSIFLAFNAHIVKELKTKLPSHVEARTCHSLGFGAVARGVPKKLNVEGYKYDNKAFELVELHYSDLQWNKKKELSSQLADLVNFARNTLTDFTSVPALVKMAQTYNIEVEDTGLYVHIKFLIEWGIEHYKNTGTIDFTDMIWLAIHLKLPLPTFDFILIDEGQDLNALQHELIDKITTDGTRVIVVGDEKQSMYGFSGALNNGLQLLKKKLNAKEMPLSICYRCPKSHIEIARHVDGNRTEWKPDAEPGILEFILQTQVMEMVKPQDLILCRLTAPLVAMCIKMLAKRIPGRVLGRNIGKTMISLVEDTMKKGKEELEAPEWSAFAERFEYHTDQLKERIGKKRNSEYQLEVLEDKREAIMACYTSPDFNISSKEAFVRSIEDIFSDKEAIITLCTIHRAKGLEANNVFLINDKSERDCMPLIWKNQKQQELDQELNIIYVSLTRAKKALYIASSTKEAVERHKNFYLNGGVKTFMSAPNTIKQSPKARHKVTLETALDEDEDCL